MLRSKKRYLGALCVASCIVMFAAACGSSDNNGGTEAAGSTTANETQEAAEPTPTTVPTAKPTPTPRPEPTPTPEPTKTRWNGPYGVYVDIEDFNAFGDFFECIDAHIDFLDITDLLIDLTQEALDNGSFTEYGLVWLGLEEALLDDFTTILFLTECEDAYPRVWQGYYQDVLFSAIDDCKIINDYSSQWEFDACLDSLDGWLVALQNMNERVFELNAWADEIYPELEEALGS